MSKVVIENNGLYKVRIKLDSHIIEYNKKFANKFYPFYCIFYNQEINDDIITEIESSKILIVDTDFNYHSESSGDSSILVVPKFGFSLDKFNAVLYSLLEKLAEKIEGNNT